MQSELQLLIFVGRVLAIEAAQHCRYRRNHFEGMAYAVGGLRHGLSALSKNRSIKKTMPCVLLSPALRPPVFSKDAPCIRPEWCLPAVIGLVRKLREAPCKLQGARRIKVPPAFPPIPRALSPDASGRD